MAPDLLTGKEYCKPVRSANEIKPGEVFNKVKNSVVGAG
jgi:hypothetical protein